MASNLEKAMWLISKATESVRRNMPCGDITDIQLIALTRELVDDYFAGEATEVLNGNN